MHLMLLLLYCLLLLVSGLCHFIRRLQPVAHLHTMLVATMQLSELGVRPLLARTRQRHRYVRIKVCLFCTGIAALLLASTRLRPMPFYQAFAAGCSLAHDASRNNATIRAGCAAAARRDSPTTPICTHWSLPMLYCYCCFTLLVSGLAAGQLRDVRPAGAVSAA